MIYEKNEVLICTLEWPTKGLIDDLIKIYERGEISTLEFFS